METAIVVDLDREVVSLLCSATIILPSPREYKRLSANVDKSCEADACS